MDLIVILICIFLMTNDVEHFFLCYWPFVYIFGEISIQIVMLKLGYFIVVVRVLYIVWIQVYYQVYKYFLPFCDLSFQTVSFKIFQNNV